MLPPEVLARYERVWPAETIPARARRVAAARNGDPVHIDGEVAMAFDDTLARIERTAAGLAARGIGRGDVVSWQLPNTWEASIVHHAILRTGALPNPIGIGLRERELRQILTEARPRAFVVPHRWRDFDHLGLARDLAADLGIADVVVARGGQAGGRHRAVALDDLMASSGPPPPVPADPAAPALLLYTSGTTSAPKGVVHTHRGLLTEVDSFIEIHALTPSDRSMVGPPVTHIAGLAYGVLAPLALGISSVLLGRWDPDRAARALGEHRVTFMTGPPTFLLTLAEAAGEPARDFRLFSTGGATIPAAQIAAAGGTLGCVVKRAYGSTEVPTLTAGRLDDDERARLHTDGAPIGLAEIAFGDDGEILARAPEMLIGYRDPAADAAAFTADGWFRTGDTGSLDADGRLIVGGRIKDIIIRGGENISAAELEELLRAHPAVADVAVIGVRDARLGERACAVVVPAPGTTPSLDELITHLRARDIATQKLPERLELVDALPRSDNGKVLKDRLRARFG